MFGTLLGSALCFGGGLVVGWFLLPTPKFVHDFWFRMGWTDRVQ